MDWRQRISFIALLAAILSGCASSDYVFDAAFNPPLVQNIQMESGDEGDVYYIDTQPNPVGTIFFITGSGCASLRYYLRKYFSSFPGSWRIYALQKAGVSSSSTGMFGCSRDFDAHATLQEFLSRNRQALKAVIAERGKVDALMGVSEGGDIAAALAAGNPNIGHLIVIGSGGMTMRESLRTLAACHALPVAPEALQGEFAKISGDPDSLDESFLGLPNRYWGSLLDADPLPYYRRIRQPAYVFMGEDDQNVPVESAYRLRDYLAQQGQNNIIVEIVSGASHALTRSGVDLKPDIFKKLNAWLLKKP